jgi:U3 small nucleolar RNA-associated protein 21
LKLLFISELATSPITCLASFKNFVFGAYGCFISAWEAGKLVYTLRAKGDDRILEILLIGDNVVAVTRGGRLMIWDSLSRLSNGAEEVDATSLEVAQQGDIIAILHPVTYLNKVLLGMNDVSVQLWNINSRKLIFQSKSFGERVVVLSQAPAVDIVGVGLGDGTIIIYNLRADMELMRFKQDTKIAAISFRTGLRFLLCCTYVRWCASICYLE